MFRNNLRLTRTLNRRIETVKFSGRTQRGSGASSLLVPSKDQATESPWKKQPDPAGSGQFYYWNTETDETTPLNSPKPQHWVSVSDPNGSGASYWWNPETNETSSLGAEKPHMYGGLTQIPTQTTVVVNQVRTDAGFMRSAQHVQQYQQVQPQTLGRSMLSYAAWGAGLTFAIAFVRSLF
jgi:hypothetical protein